MFIRELEIKDNTRLMIRGTNFINIRFQEIYQLILGTNGCGKSTIMQELSPLPASGGDYMKNGYKKIVIEHKNKLYTLTSRFSTAAGKHSFIDETTGEDLNPGGTQSTQRILIEQIFGFDQSLHEVLTDQVKFTNMSPLTRRDWLTRMSGTNLDFAIDIFNKIKKAQKDEDAVLKHLTNRLNKESGDLIDKEALEELKEKCRKLDDRIKELYSHRIHEQLNSPEVQMTRLDNQIAKCNELAQTLLRIPLIKPNGITCFNDMVEERDSIEKQLQFNNGAIQSLINEHQEISEMLATVESIKNEGDVEELQGKLDQLSSNINQLKSATKYIHDVENAIEHYGNAMGVSQILTEVMSGMIDNTEGYITRDKRDKAREDLDKILLDLSTINRNILKAEHDKNHILSMETIDCPECHFRFKPGVNENDLPKIDEFIKSANGKISELEKRREQLVSFLDECSKYANDYKRFTDIMNQNRSLDFIWAIIKPLSLRDNHPTKILSTYNECFNDLKNLAQVQRILPEVYKIEASINKANSVKNNTNFSQDRLNKIENQINDYRNENRKLEERLSALKTFYRNHEKMQILYNELKESLVVMDNEINNLYKSHKKVIIETAITDVNNEVAVHGLALREAQNRQDIIDDINKSRMLSLEQNEYLKLLIAEINPTSGIIADFFKQFIEQFVDQMNIIINKVWEHSMVLLPCEIGAEGISYKFPLRINDKPYGPPDGSKGSNSQVTIVNFAFKIVVMIYLGLEDYPLYLDELAPDLDEKHRINIVSFVRSFVESKRCSQMFMVSHYISGYGAFTNAQTLVIDEENLLELPQSYNHHAVIKKEAKEMIDTEAA